MKKIFRYFQKISFLSALMVVWSVLSAVVMIAQNIQTSLVAISILVFVAVLSIIRPFPLSSWLSLLAGSIFYAVICYSLFGLGEKMFITVGVAVAFYFVTVLLAGLYSHQTNAMGNQVQKDQSLLDDLVQYDQTTGILRWKYAQKKLKAEVVRSSRYKSDLSLVLIQMILPDRAGITEKELMNLTGQVVEVILDGVRRDVDIIFIGEKFGIILPETSSEGAQILAARLADRIDHKVRIEIAVGIASVPNDAVKDSDLIESAEMALRFALNANQSVVPASRLREAAEEKSAKKKGSEKKADEVIVQKTELDSLGDPLGQDEWRLEFFNFKLMNALPVMEKQITSAGDISDFQFLSLDDTRLVVKITSREQNLLAKLGNLPLFNLKKADMGNHLIQFEMKADN